MDINENIKQQLQGKPDSSVHEGNAPGPQCGFSAKTVQALMACGERFAYVNILDNDELREAPQDLFQLAHVSTALRER